MKVILLSPEELQDIIHFSIRKFLAESDSAPSVDYDKPMTMEEAAEFLNLPKATLYQFTSTRKIGFKKLGKRIVFTKQNLLDFLEQNQKKSKKQLENELLIQKGGRRQ